jgi:hypothetical protein
MKGYELMKLTKENPSKYKGKRYKYIRGAKPRDCKDRTHEEFYISKYGEFLIEKSIFKLFISDDTEVEEIQQPIPSLEAIKAYEEGKTVRCEIDGKIFIFEGKYENGKLRESLYDTSCNSITANQILRGTWFVEVEQ